MDNSLHNDPGLLVRYLDNELTGADKQQLEEQLASDTSLQEQLAGLQQTREAVRWYGLQQTVSSVHRQMMEEMQAPVRPMRSTRKIIRYVMAAAASVLLIVLGIAGYNFYNLSADKVFADNYQSYNSSIVRGGNTTHTAAEEAYSAKQYDLVIMIYNDRQDSSQKAGFLAGMSYLELNNTAGAIRCFNEVIDKNSRTGALEMNDETEYYLALTYIRHKDYNEALKLLEKIKADTAHTYHANVNARLIRQVKWLRWK